MDDEDPADDKAEERRLGTHARLCRKARGLTQDALAERSGLAVDTIRRLEHGSFSPSFDTLRKVCVGFDLSMATFFEGYELGERNKARELAEALDFLTPDEERALYQFLDVVRGRFDRGDE